MKKKNTNPNQPSLLKTLQTYVMVGLQEFWQNLKGRKTLAIGMTAALATIPTVFVACVPKDTTPPEAPDASGNEKPKPQEPTTPNPGEQEKPTNPSQPENPDPEQPEKPDPEQPENPNPEQPTNPIESISDLTDEQKQLLVNYIDENYKDQIINKASYGTSSAKDAITIGYDIDLNNKKVEALYNFISEEQNNFTTIGFNADINLDKIIKALSSEDSNFNPSDFIKITSSSIGIKNAVVMNKKDNEYSEKAPEVYATLLEAQGKENLTTASSIYSVTRGSDSTSEDLGVGLWPNIRITVLTIKDGKYDFNTLRFITKDYNNICNNNEQNFVIVENESYSFGSENTIFAKSNENEIVGVNLNGRTYEIAYIENTPFLEQ